MWKQIFDDAGPPRYGFRTALFESTRSGLHVLVGDVDGPMLNAYITLRTETHDNRGLPHTLEHLVFLGTKHQYPYKGLLDTLAQSILSSGTNAWTAQDHTTYTLEAASKVGILGVLPLFLDHIFFPLLLDEHYGSEVYAVSGTAEDIGVVFSEMQSMERKLNNLTSMAMAKLLYGDSSFSVETGGTMEALRDTQTMNMDAVRDYHRATYVPNNAMLVLTGAKIDTAALLASLDEVDARLATLRRNDFPRPFDTLLPPLAGPERVADVVFPSESEEFGRADIAWRLDGTLIELMHQREFTATVLLCDYLSDGISSPLHIALVDLEQPYCRSVDNSFDLFRQPGFSLTMNGVPVEMLDTIKQRVMETLRNQLDHFDMARMTRIIERSLLDEISEMEQEPSNTVQDNASVTFLYGKSVAQFLDVLWGEQPRMRALLNEPRQFWIDLLRRVLVDAPRAVCISRPSASLHAQFAAQDKALLDKRIQTLGEEGLKQLQTRLDAATASINASVAPQELVHQLRQRLKVDLDAVTLHAIQTWRNKDAATSTTLPEWLRAHLYPLQSTRVSTFEFDHCARTAFADVAVYVMGVDKLSKRDKCYLELFCELLFECPIGELSHIDVANLLERDLISYSGGIGITSSRSFSPGAFPSVLHVFARAKVDNYAVAVDWIRKGLLEGDVLNADRVQVAVHKMLSRIAEYERSPSRVLADRLHHLLLEPSALARCVTFSAQKEFLEGYERRPKKFVRRFGKAVARIRALVRLPNMLVHVVANASRVYLPRQPWLSWPSVGDAEPLSRVKPISAFVKSKAFKGHKVDTIPMPIDGANVTECWEGPSYSYGHEDIPALLVLTDMLSASEGPLWVAIRGRGLAYGARFTLNPHFSHLLLEISECSSAADMDEALRVARDVLEKDDAAVIDHYFETGLSVALGDQIGKLATHQSTAESRFMSLFRGYTTDAMIQRVAQVTRKDVARVWRYWAKPSTRVARGSRTVITMGQDSTGGDDDESGGDGTASE